MTNMYRRPPSIGGRKGPAMSTWRRRPACEGVYKSLLWERRVALASVQEAQEVGAECRRLPGASEVNSVSRLRLAWPQWRRRCMC
eukprot:3651816-Pleurochrysis_carterae.AAC.1